LLRLLFMQSCSEAGFGSLQPESALDFFYIYRPRVDSSFNPVVGGQDCCWGDDQLEKIKKARAVLHFVFILARAAPQLTPFKEHGPNNEIWSQ
jgi:hypothetical protein